MICRLSPGAGRHFSGRESISRVEKVFYLVELLAIMGFQFKQRLTGCQSGSDLSGKNHSHSQINRIAFACSTGSQAFQSFAHGSAVQMLDPGRLIAFIKQFEALLRLGHQRIILDDSGIPTLGLYQSSEAG